jgi:NAD(P)H-dependent FMN reductase
MARIALIVGSVRRDRQGIRVTRLLIQKLQTRDHIIHFIDPLELNLPLLDRMYKDMKVPLDS